MGAPHFLDFFIFSYLEKQMHKHLLNQQFHANGQSIILFGSDIYEHNTRS